MTVHNHVPEIDNWVDEENAATNHGNDTALWTRWDDGGKGTDYERRTIMRIGDTDVANGHCQDAWLEMRVLEVWGTPASKRVHVQRMSYWAGVDNTDWQETGSSWTYRGFIGGSWQTWHNPPAGSGGGGINPSPASIGDHIFRLADPVFGDGKNAIKKLVDEYRDSNSGDTHFCFAPSSQGEDDWGFTIAARDHATVAYRPVLVICEAGTDRRRHC